MFVMLSKLGVYSASVTAWIAPLELFPTLFQATAFGILSLSANLVTIVAP